MRGGRNHHDAPRSQLIEDTQDTPPERGSAHDGIVNHHEVVVFTDRPVGNIVNVSYQTVAPGIGSDKGTQLGILNHDLFNTGFPANDGIQRLLTPRGFALAYLALLLLHHVLLYPLHHAVERCFRRVGDKRKHRVIEITIHRTNQLRRQ